MTTRQTPDAVREAIIAAIMKADANFGYSYRLTKMDETGEEHTLFMDGFEPAVFQDRGDGYPVIEQRRNTARTAAILAALDSRAGSTTPKDTLVAYLRAIGFDTHAENVAAGHGVLLPSYVALDLLAQPQSYAASPEEVRERAQLLADVELHLKSSRIFITTREKMHPCGVTLHDELLGRVTAAIDNIGKANSHD